MYLEIVSPEAKLFSGEIESLTVPGTSGSFQVLNNHAPIVSTLAAGQVIIQGSIKLEDDQKNYFKQEGSTTYFEIQSGAIEMRDNKVILVTD
ncbi:MAG: F-type H+-transporting ATPase subunit epsilon [Flavobacteriaceae bacterium]|mgnify:CR=1 FL=1|jgi:F-type H+-transporting ATPase subunit epsilon|tara:strand:- start:5130 stop:5405 length:276 start_codon:yes stop_codon:yes gene_type:complete